MQNLEIGLIPVDIEADTIVLGYRIEYSVLSTVYSQNAKKKIKTK